MTVRYLFGPVSSEYADQHLSGPRQDGRCLAFGYHGEADLTIGPGDSWEDVCRRLPSGWRPDFVAVYLPYTPVPPCVWSAPVPLVGLAADWNLLYHGYQRLLGCCELALTDTAGVEALARDGIGHARTANLYGLGRDFLEHPWPDADRPIHCLFIGNLHRAIHRSRLAWLGRLARLAGRWRVVIATGVFGEDYRALLSRARVVFNRSVRGECNQRTFEAVAAGALLFQEASNREVHSYLRDRQECVCYGDDDLEALLEHYLEHEGERRVIAEVARARVSEFAFAALWEQGLGVIEQEWDALADRARQRPALPPGDELLARTWQALGGPLRDPALLPDLARAADAGGHTDVTLLHALGLVAGLAGFSSEAALYFRRVVDADPYHVVAGLSLVEALLATGQVPEAIEQAQRTLPLLDREAALDPRRFELPPYPPGFDLVRAEWERAAWGSAGRPRDEALAKRTLVRFRLHALLADLTGDLVHFHEAALARPDLPVARGGLGCALGRAGRLAEALPHLREAVAGDPFDAPAAQALAQVLSDLGDDDARRRLARDRRLLASAAPGVVRSEPWFADARPVGDELASIIVLCHNQLEYTRLCLESVLRHTRAPYELVVVDNASTDGTAEYLKELCSRPGPDRVAVIRNASNVGFPAGCNQGLAAARGQYLVFLNNDTVVTEGWLDGLVAWALADWPRVGLVGPVTGASRPPQEVAVDYTDLGELPAFAARRRQEFAGQCLEVERLTGFCLLARRDVLDQVGGFDERFGLGFFDDDDLSVRARRAGFRLLVALDVFVHHFGNRTFTLLGIDCRAQLQGNFAKFRSKWGPEEARGYRLPGADEHASPEPTPTAIVPAALCRRQRVSLTMIVKNEEKNLADCLASVIDLVDQAVVTDTGSTDRTKEIAARFGPKVLVTDFPWVDSFAAARNESLRHATGNWVFWLDADDRLDYENRQKLRALFASLIDENAAYVMKCLCLPDPESRTGTVVDHVRLFRNRPDLRWQHRVHEQILPAVRGSGGQVRWSDVIIHHTGYLDPALQRHKQQRNLRLLALEEAEQPDHPFTLFNLGSAYQELGRLPEALAYFGRSLALSQPSDSIVRKLYALIAQGHRQLGRAADALAACEGGRAYYPDDAELLFVEGLVRYEGRDLVGAAARLERLIAGGEPEHFGSVASGLRGYKARHLLGSVYRELGRAADAEREWRLAVAECPGWQPAWLALGELLLSQGRWAEVEEAAGRLEADGGAWGDAAVLRARGLLARREFAAARRLLEETIARAPEAVWPRLVLTHVLLQEGGDGAAAERALRDVLALDPSNAEARHNLEVLLRRQGRAAG
jgi:GT2 family glycosyltransferase/predicted Zn-dependent protease